MQLEDPARAQLAEQAAAGLPVLPRLRLIWLGEALSAPPPRRPLGRPLPKAPPRTKRSRRSSPVFS